MEPHEIIDILNSNYAYHFKKVEFLRDGGSLSYAAFTENEKYFLRTVRPELMDTALRSVDIQIYLIDKGFPAPRIIFTNGGAPYLASNGNLYILYEYIEGGEPDRDTDIERIGELVGRLHETMRNYPGKPVTRDKYFFIDRYVEILGKMKYPEHKVRAYKEYGDDLWNRVKDLPRGYCHCDLYIGNVYRAVNGGMYILDFDTSCDAFPVYDAALVCNANDYFKFDESECDKTGEFLERFFNGYQRHNSVSPRERLAVGDLLAVYHYQLQATIIEIYGLDCVDHKFLDEQFGWLMKWEKRRKSIPL